MFKFIHSSLLLYGSVFVLSLTILIFYLQTTLSVYYFIAFNKLKRMPLWDRSNGRSLSLTYVI